MAAAENVLKPLDVKEAKEKEWRSKSAQDTQEMGRCLGRSAEPGDVLLLVGGLGAGKTMLSQGVGEALGVIEPVNSPTFVLMRQYGGRLPLYHYDLYRVSNLSDTISREWDELLYGQGISIVEWADRALDLLPPEHLLIEFAIESEATRILKLRGVGRRYVHLLNALPCC